MITEIQKQLSKFVTIEVFNVTKENVRKNASDISDLADEISALKRAMEKMQRELDKVAGVTPAELTLIKNRLDKAESDIVNMKRAIQDLQAKIRELMKNAGKQGGGGGVSEAYFKDLEDALNKLSNDVSDHKDDTQRKFMHTQGELNTKASKDDLLDLENRLLDKIKEMI